MSHTYFPKLSAIAVNKPLKRFKKKAVFASCSKNGMNLRHLLRLMFQQASSQFPWTPSLTLKLDNALYTCGSQNWRQLHIHGLTNTDYSGTPWLLQGLSLEIQNFGSVDSVSSPRADDPGGKAPCQEFYNLSIPVLSWLEGAQEEGRGQRPSPTL